MYGYGPVAAAYGVVLPASSPSSGPDEHRAMPLEQLDVGLQLLQLLLQRLFPAPTDGRGSSRVSHDPSNMQWSICPPSTPTS